MTQVSEKKVSVISKKLCTRIINVKNGVQKFNIALMSGFFLKIISILPLQIWTSPIILNPL